MSDSTRIPPTPVTISPDTPTPHFDVDEMRRIFEADQSHDNEQMNSSFLHLKSQTSTDGLIRPETALLAEFDQLMKDFEVWSHAHVSRRAIEDQMDLENMAQELAKEEERNQQQKNSIAALMRSIVGAVEAFRQDKIDVSPVPTQD
ncbi:BZ3500_MvSof-1268-A1-R1_Chr6-2g08465 [Microbotryum saponariae]|uniref:BZ3500_MvSof-1268-A1-R1_Chr6-2g08465 protein n=1 Tax=Microbotryum saponariae TaxID=289078 RepID=A0A2X0KK07_9BASI|nr:BZ3500_MvSof-1268-A1-R1_Chr6-2g08465 [Microbotryum saponariae]SDA07742.1 BZ3501_MvSof-1269-A2-R1_Chr6-1g08179 [Microbotryum saponariae]